MNYPLKNFSRTVLFSSLLLVALVGLSGCPDDGGGNGNDGNGGNGNPPDTTPPDTTPPDTTPPAQAVRLNNVSANGADLLFELVNPNSEAVQVGITVEPAAPSGAMIEFDGDTVPFTAAVRIALAISGESGATKQVRLAALTRETDYTLTATTFDTNGNAHSEPATESATTLPPIPAAPANLSTSAVANSSVALIWNTVTGATAYNVYRAGTAAAIANTGTATTHTDDGLTGGTEYTYTVRAVNAGGESDSSSPLSVITIPDAPNLTANVRRGGVDLSWSAVTGADEYYIYRATGSGTAERIDDANSMVTTTSYTDSTVTGGTDYSYTVRAVNANGESAVSTAEAVTAANSIDSDGDLLIDIFVLEELNNVRYNLAGTAYKTSESDSGVKCGGTGDTDCSGYELMNDLDFSEATHYSSGAINTDWRPAGGNAATATNAGWVPIGGGFSAILEGNGNAISNLYIRGSGNLGFFSNTRGATIRNLGMINAMVYGGSATDNIGVFVGDMSGGILATSYASGGVVDGRGGTDSVGGLAGNASGAPLVASYATVAVSGGVGDDDVGGLVGSLSSPGSTVIASYATGAVDGGSEDDNVGGLAGSAGVGALIVASYATGNVDGGDGTDDTGGQLVGRQATVGGLGFTTTVSYGFGTVSNSETAGLNGTTRPSGVTSANGLTLALAGSQWSAAASLTSGAWNFNNSSTPPTLQYADYDGSGTAYACATATNPPAGAVLIAGANCGTSTADPLPNQ